MMLFESYMFTYLWNNHQMTVFINYLLQILCRLFLWLSICSASHVLLIRPIILLVLMYVVIFRFTSLYEVN